MITLRVTENAKFGFIAIVTLISLNFWSFKLIDGPQYDVIELLACLCVVGVVLFNSRVFLRRHLPFKTIVLLFLLLPLLSVIGANLFHDQPIGLSLMINRLNLFWLFYFVLHVFDISAEKIVKMMVLIGCVWAFLTIVQQYTYPIAFFYQRDEDNAGFLRGDLLRLMPAGQGYGIFMLLYFFHKYLITQKAYTLLFVGLALGGLYFYGTRQGLAVAVACMLVGVLLIKGIAKWGYLVLFSLLALFIIVVLQPAMIMHYIELTSKQTENEDYVRYLAMDFYLNEYWPHWGAKLLGNGKPHQSVDYGVEMNYITTTLGLWRSDVGIIGAYNTYGLFYVFTIIWVNLKGIFTKIKDDNDKYLRLLFFFPTFLLPLNVGYAAPSVICYLCLVYYLMDKSLQPTKKEASLSVNQVDEYKEKKMTPIPE